MTKFLLTKKRSANWETLKEGESIIIDSKHSDKPDWIEVKLYLEKIGKKPKGTSDVVSNSFDIKKV
jgi:hypothetical protein